MNRPIAQTQLSQDYLGACRSDWKGIHLGDAQIPLVNIYVMLEAMTFQNKPTATRNEVSDTAERHEHTGRGKRKSDEDQQPDNFVQAKNENDVDGVEQAEHQIRVLPISDVLHLSQHIMLLGEPGAGKTVTLQFVGMCFATDTFTQERLQLKDVRYPILIDLSIYSDLISQPTVTLTHVMSVEIARRLQTTTDIASELLANWIASDQLLLLIDGLDEVSDLLIASVRKQIQLFSNSPIGKKARIIITSRLAGYQSLSSEIEEYTLRPLQDQDDILLYLENWLAALHPNLTRIEAVRKARLLFDEIGSEIALRTVLDNPLLLRLIAEVYVKSNEIVKNRAQLYEQWLETLWDRALKRDANPDLKDEIFHNLNVLAWSLHNEVQPPDDIALELLREKMGVIALVENNIVFSHLTIREFLVAKILQQMWERSAFSTLRFLRPHTHSPKWREPILLLGGLVRNPRILILMVMCASGHPGLRQKSLGFALEIYAQSGQIDERLENIIVTRLFGLPKIVRSTLSSQRWLQNLSSQRWLQNFWLFLVSCFAVVIPFLCVVKVGNWIIPILTKIFNDVFSSRDIISDQFVGTLVTGSYLFSIYLLSKKLNLYRWQTKTSEARLKPNLEKLQYLQHTSIKRSLNWIDVSEHAEIVFELLQIRGVKSDIPFLLTFINKHPIQTSNTIFQIDNDYWLDWISKTETVNHFDIISISAALNLAYGNQFLIDQYKSVLEKLIATTGLEETEKLRSTLFHGLIALGNFDVINEFIGSKYLDKISSGDFGSIYYTYSSFRNESEVLTLDMNVLNDIVHGHLDRLITALLTITINSYSIYSGSLSKLKIVNTEQVTPELFVAFARRMPFLIKDAVKIIGAIPFGKDSKHRFEDAILDYVSADIQNQDFSNLEHMIELLGQFKSKRAIPLLTELSNVPQFTYASLRNLATIGDPSSLTVFQKHLDTLKSFHADARILRNINGLRIRTYSPGSGGSESLNFVYIANIDWLLHGLKHDNPDVRHECLNQLHRLSFAIPSTLLLSLLDDSCLAVRIEALYQLGEYREPQFSSKYKSLFETEIAVEMKKHALVALGKTGTYNSVKYVWEQLASHKIACIEALSHSQNEQALEYLIDLLDKEDEPPSKSRLADAIGNFRGEKGLVAMLPINGPNSEASRAYLANYWQDANFESPQLIVILHNFYLMFGNESLSSERRLFGNIKQKWALEGYIEVLLSGMIKKEGVYGDRAIEEVSDLLSEVGDKSVCDSLLQHLKKSRYKWTKNHRDERYRISIVLKTVSNLSAHISDVSKVNFLLKYFHKHYNYNELIEIHYEKLCLRKAELLSQKSSNPILLRSLQKQNEKKPWLFIIFGFILFGLLALLSLPIEIIQNEIVEILLEIPLVANFQTWLSNNPIWLIAVIFIFFSSVIAFAATKVEKLRDN